MTPTTPLLDAVSAFETALSVEGNAEVADVNAAEKLAAATAAKAATAEGLATAKTNVYGSGADLIASIQAIIAPFAPPSE